jgi:hypothetical protein
MTLGIQPEEAFKRASFGASLDHFEVFGTHESKGLNLRELMSKYTDIHAGRFT